MPTRRRWGRVRKLTSGRWQARYPHPDTGLLTPAPHTFKTKTDAARWLEQAEVDQRRGEWTDPTDRALPLGPWGERWIAAQTHWKPKTRADNESLWRTHLEPRWGNVKLGSVRPIDVQEWVSKLECSASRVRKAYGLLAQIMEAAEHNQLIPVTPCRGVRLPRLAQHDPTILTPEQVRALADAATGQNKVAVLVLAYAGLRVGELFGLRRRHFDGLHGRLLVARTVSEVSGRLHDVPPKNHQEREVALHPSVALLLAQHVGGLRPDPDAFLFEAPRGGPVRYTNWLHRVWEPACVKAGLVGVTPHDLRATHASWLGDAGVNPVDVGVRLGHAPGNTKVTLQHYIRAGAGRDDANAAKLRVVES